MASARFLVTVAVASAVGFMLAVAIGMSALGSLVATPIDVGIETGLAVSKVTRRTSGMESGSFRCSWCRPMSWSKLPMRFSAGRVKLTVLGRGLAQMILRALELAAMLPSLAVWI